MFEEELLRDATLDRLTSITTFDGWLREGEIKEHTCEVTESEIMKMKQIPNGQFKDPRAASLAFPGKAWNTVYCGLMVSGDKLSP